MIGLDYSPFQSSILGIAIGYEFTNLDTIFNRGEAESEGFTVAPYFGMLIDDIWSIDASFGYSLIDTDQFRRLTGSNSRISSSLDTDRWFGTVNINGNHQFGNWLIGGKLGLLFARSIIQDDFRESDGTRVSERTVELNNINFGGNISYFYKSFEPFALINYQNEFSSTKQEFSTAAQPENDDDVLIALGVRYFGDNGITANIEYSKRLFRADYEEDTFNLTIRGEF